MLLLQHRAVLQLGDNECVIRPQHPESPGKGAAIELVVLHRHPLALDARGVVRVGRGNVQPAGGMPVGESVRFGHGQMSDFG
ncbi:hypothetical protein D3C85_1449970 [compost metagenome]